MNLLIDGSSLIHRAHWVNSNHPMKMGEVFIFLRSLKSYIKMFESKSIYVCWDKKIIKSATNFRHEISDTEYKGNRDKSKAKDVYSNEESLTTILNCLGVKNMYPRIMEADDIIAWLSTTLDGPNIIVTADKDMLQLVSEKTSFYNPSKKVLIDPSNFEKEVGVKKDAFLFYKAINGDQSDNIPGWPGYGKVKSKAAAEQIADDYASIKQYDVELKLIFERNLRLMNLEQGYNKAGPEEIKAYQEQFDTLIDLEPDLDKFRFYCEKFEFKQFLKKFNEWENIFKGSRLLSVLNNMFS
ncbi:MAG: hypothetical protein JSW62_03080 [Thermoplasmatales archaeon]|nr:MAG: hypothetical protein JSW62_03080 [Thermoplasmatales archaeon]